PMDHVRLGRQLVGGEIRLLRQGEQGGAGDDQVALDPQFAQGVQHARAIDDARSARDSND
ncbi:hypothetical protein LTR94_033454, partial [Friedmanniomyces endolithicus]